jgi:hypothetical protein
MKGEEFRFNWESATGRAGGAEVLQELVSYYTKSPANPDGYSLDSPFALAGGIREITVESKRAIIVQ